MSRDSVAAAELSRWAGGNLPEAGKTGQGAGLTWWRQGIQEPYCAAGVQQGP